MSYLVSTEQHWSTREHFEAAATIVKQLSWDKLPQLLEAHFEAIWQLLVPSLQDWSDNPAAANRSVVVVVVINVINFFIVILNYIGNIVHKNQIQIITDT